MGMPIWHDEAQRFERTGQPDQGPCWCPECIEAESAAKGAEQ